MNLRHLLSFLVIVVFQLPNIVILLWTFLVME